MWEDRKEISDKQKPTINEIGRMRKKDINRIGKNKWLEKNVIKVTIIQNKIYRKKLFYGKWMHKFSHKKQEPDFYGLN